MRVAAAAPHGRRRGLSGNFFAGLTTSIGRPKLTFESSAIVHRSGMTLILLLLFSARRFAFGRRLPTSFLPDEDQGFFYINLQLPDAASLQRTDAVCREIESMLSQTDGVQYSTTIAGFSLLSGVQSTYWGIHFRNLQSWEDRKKLTRKTIR